MRAEIEQLFHTLTDLSPDARAQYLAEHEIDGETRREVEALLAFDSGASAFLAREVSIVAGRALPQLEGKGLRCGPYRLLDTVGRGGMGTVYLAERVDGEVTQRAAVKLLAPGAGEIQRERFLRERQILASLSHPNIARMLDAGHLESGQPFLAMEYVDGEPIDVFAAGMSVRDKIALFLKVCAAVAYLHRNLVVHRDLKPSNILVTDVASGQPGEPKLLDFGIAKLLDIATDSTLTSLRMLTPDYASPEQMAGGQLSAATDIYSLGAVLYKLLTGKPAHEFDDRSAEGIARTVTTREVTRPSKWAPELKGDLESILLKALRKDPQERYASVNEFAEDLEAYLASRAVRARSGTAWYRARKFLRRNRTVLAVALTSPVSVAAVIGIASLIAVSGPGAGLYTRFRNHPADVQIKSLAVLPLENLSGDAAQEYFADGVMDELITALAKINSVKVISRTSVMQYKGVHNKLLPQIARELGVDAVVEGTVVNSGDRVRVSAQLIEATTDRHIWADRYERSSRDILLLENEISKAIAEQLRGKLDAHEQRRFIGNPIDPAAHELYLQGLSLWYRRTPHALEEAIRYYTQAIEKEPRYAEAYTGRAMAYIVLGNGSMEAIGPEEAMLKGRADAEKAVQLDETSSDAHAARGAIRNLYGWDWRGTETEMRRAIELNPNNATARYWYGNYLCNVGRFEECLAETDRAHALDPGYLIIAVDVGCRLYEARRYAEAISPIQKVLEFNPDFAGGRLCLGQVYEANRRYPEAIAELRKALELSGGAAIYRLLRPRLCGFRPARGGAQATSEAG
jgi:TolB-like protein